jgi:hypothetical protein
MEIHLEEDYTTWKIGYVMSSGKKYKFKAKVYQVPSSFGIDGGRVSKLEVGGIINYDRGWFTMPRLIEHKHILEGMVDYLEKLPIRVDD